MHVAVMGKRPYMQIVGVVDVFADLEHQRQWVIRPQIGGITSVTSPAFVDRQTWQNTSSFLHPPVQISERRWQNKGLSRSLRTKDVKRQWSLTIYANLNLNLSRAEPH
jgi:hypothetical protein